MITLVKYFLVDSKRHCSRRPPRSPGRKLADQRTREFILGMDLSIGRRPKRFVAVGQNLRESLTLKRGSHQRVLRFVGQGFQQNGGKHQHGHVREAMRRMASIQFIEALVAFPNEFPEKEDIFLLQHRDGFYVTTESRFSFHTGPSGYWYASKVSGSISVLYPGFSGSR